MKWAIYCLPTGGIKTKSFFLCTLKTMCKEKRPPRAIPQRTSRISGSYRSVWRKQRVVSMRVPRCRGPRGSGRGHRLPAMGEQQGTAPHRAKKGPVNFRCTLWWRTHATNLAARCEGAVFYPARLRRAYLVQANTSTTECGPSIRTSSVGVCVSIFADVVGGHARPASRTFTRQNRL